MRRGVGLVVMFQRAAAPEPAAGNLVALPLDLLPVAEQYHLICRRSHRFSPLAQHLMAFIRGEATKLAASVPGR